MYISSNTWSIANGISCLIQVVIFFPLVIFFDKGSIIENIDSGIAILQLIIGCLILGIFVSWFSTIWWNKVSRHLPTTLAAQLIVFETISSLTYGYIKDQTFPQPIILMCIGIVLLGVVSSIRVANSIQIRIYQLN